MPFPPVQRTVFGHILSRTVRVLPPRTRLRHRVRLNPFSTATFHPHSHAHSVPALSTQAQAPSFSPGFIHSQFLRGHRSGVSAFVGKSDLTPRQGRSLRRQLKGMSFRRRGRKRRRTGGASFVARKALSEVRKLKRKVETKMVDKASQSFANVLVAGQIATLCDIAQGNTRQTRDGNKITPSSLLIMYNWQGATADVSGVYRLIVIRDKQQIQGTTPAVLDVLQTTTALSLYNEDFKSRFSIKYDQMWTGANDTNIHLNFAGRIRIKLTLPMLYGTASAADITKNGLYIIAISTLASNGPNLVFHTRLRYTDL